MMDCALIIWGLDAGQEGPAQGAVVDGPEPS